jgi:hypothetical protein
MHEKRNFILVLVFAAVTIWASIAWMASGPIGQGDGGIWTQRVISMALMLGLGGFLIRVLWFTDRLQDQLAEAVGSIYYEADGVCFMPLVRLDSSGAAELRLYYQNRFENPAHAVVHLRPMGECFSVRNSGEDIHIAFTCGGGDFGIIHQPIRVPTHLRGEVIDLKLAATSRYPRSHGGRLRSNQGMPCGTVRVDWAGAPFRLGVHETSDEIELTDPVQIHLAIPRAVRQRGSESMQWRQEQLFAGVVIA